MRLFSTGLASLAMVPAFVAAHSSNGLKGVPRIIGDRRLAEEFQARAAAVAADIVPSLSKVVPTVEKRFDSMQCGPSAGGQVCPSGYCCSAGGWCGQDEEYCASPDCLINYSDSCDSLQKPSGGDTSGVARPLLGSVNYGAPGFYDCTVPNTIALTYDDGPYIYTDTLIKLLNSYDAKATFFITGNNIGKGPIDTTAAWSQVIKDMHATGHQIASHTWGHENLDAITSAQRHDQMIYNEIALQNILGFFPTYMRPPYSACVTTACMKDMKTLGYHIAYFDLDTDDYDNTLPTTVQNAKDNFDRYVNGKDPQTNEWLAIAHDIHDQTVNNLTVYMLDRIRSLGYRPVTLGECLSDPVSNWYRSGTGTTTQSSTQSSTSRTGSATRPSSSSTASASGKVSTDGTCGGTSGFTCKGSSYGDCCSQYGWCGTTPDHCNSSCQSAFGVCPGSGSSSSTSTSATSSSAGSSSSKASTSTSSSASASASSKVSNNGTCGGTTGFTCKGSTYGDCCSQYGWCGSTPDHCNSSCQSAFGVCPGSGSSSNSQTSSATSNTPSSTRTTSSATATSTLKVSVDGSCGNGVTCQGSTFGNCCSQYGWCGSTTDYCGTGCKPSFGTCSVSESDSESEDSGSSTSSTSLSSSSQSSSVESSSTQSSSVESSSVESSSSQSSSVESSSTPSSSQSSSDESSSTQSSSTQSSSVESSSQSSSSETSSTQSSFSETSSTQSSSQSCSDESSSTPSSSTQSSSSDASSTQSSSSETSSTQSSSSTSSSTSSTSSSTPSSTGIAISTEGRCGRHFQQTCLGSKYGRCCNYSGRCSADLSQCIIGCSKKYGFCLFPAY